MNYMMNGMSSEESDEKKSYSSVHSFSFGAKLSISGSQILYTVLPMNL